MREVRFGLLGPFDIRLDGEQVSISGAAERALLTLLLLSPGRPVPATSLIDRLWAEATLPVDPMNALQLRVSKLRRALTAADLPVVTRDGTGYRVDVDPESIDTEAFVRRLRRARAQVAAALDQPSLEALAAYDEALALWRGPALVDFATEPWAVAESVRLEELASAARLERAQVALGVGRHLEVIAELEPRVSADPTQEAMAGLLMIALYRAGRQVAALDVFTRTRTLLDEELGLEPSASLRALHERVLRQDPSLGAALDVSIPVPVVPAAESRRAESPTHPTNLPAALQPLIGREGELSSVRAMVAEHRLITLVGPGGAGKTTLGLNAASALLEAFADGVFAVRLAPVRESGQVATAVADALGMPLDGASATRDVRSRLVGYLSGKRMLLLIDNCEHVIDAAATLLDELLARCPDLCVLATSREALAVPAEVQVLVGPLATPPEHVADREVLEFPAAQLFLRRATAARPAIDPTAADLPALGRICRALDGMPLALELAAARVTSLSLPEIADRLDNRFTLLTTGSRTAEDRQRTLRATVDWSHELLSDLEKRVFRRLAVFQGGWTLQAAEAVVADEKTTASEVLHATGRLVEQSLVVAESGPATRYRMLETLREYAADRLRESGEAHALAQRHAKFFGLFADQAARGLRGPRQRESLRALKAEHANLRAALTWLAGPMGDADGALRMAGQLGLFWHQGRHLEGREILRRLLARDSGSRPARALALQALSLVERPRACIVHPSPVCAEAARESLRALQHVDASAAALSKVLLAVEGVTDGDLQYLALLDEAEAQFRNDGDPWGEAVIGFVRMEAALKAGKESTALQWSRAAATAFRQLEDLWGLSAVLYHLGWGLRLFGRYEEASRTLEEAVDVAAGAGLDNTVQWALADLGITYAHLGELDAATDAFVRAKAASDNVGDGAGAVLAQYGDGLLAGLQGQWGRARESYAGAAHGFEELGTPAMQGQALLGLSRALEALGDAEHATELLQRVLSIAPTAGEPTLPIGAHEGLARLAATRGDLGQAAELLRHATELRTSAHRPPTPLELRDITALRHLLR